MGMDVPQKSNPSIHVNTIYTLRRGKTKGWGRIAGGSALIAQENAP